MFETKVRFFLRVGGISQPYGGLNGETSHSLVMPWEMAIKSGICRSFFRGESIGEKTQARWMVYFMENPSTLW